MSTDSSQPSSDELLPPYAPPLDETVADQEPEERGPTAPLGVPQRAQGSRRSTVNVVLFCLTLATTIYWGFIQYQSFHAEELGTLTFNPLRAPAALLAGVPYGLAVIAFLLAHEMGHYLACRYYGLRATLPYFIPIPPVLTLLPGTMGAVIRILSPIRRRRALFDIAVAGPIAGFLVALPILGVGLAQSRVIPTPSDGSRYLEMGEPLLWTPLEWMFAPSMTQGQDLLLHPLAFVGWFALLVTAMNLLPVGQLDGGHIMYAFFPGQHRLVSVGLVVAMVLAGFFYFTGWFFFAALIAFLLGTRHPPLQSFEPLGRERRILALVALAIFVGAFTLVPVRISGGF